jgi:hypothetical protein
MSSTKEIQHPELKDSLFTLRLGFGMRNMNCGKHNDIAVVNLNTKIQDNERKQFGVLVTLESKTKALETHKPWEK